MKKQIAVLFAVAVAIAWVSCSQGQRAVNLRFSFQPDSNLTYDQISKRNYNVIRDDSTVAQRLVLDTLRITLECVRRVDDTTYEIIERSSFNRIVKSSEDSTKTEVIPITSETLFHFITNGRVQSFEMLEDGMNRSTTYIENYYEQGTPVFPSGEKPVGYSWTQTSTVVLPEQTLEASTTYTIRALVRQAGYDCALIEYAGNMIIPVVSRSSSEEDGERTGVDRIQITGKMYFAHKEGRVIEQSENWKIDGDRTAVYPDSSYDYKVMQDYSVSYKLVNVETAP